MHTIPIFMKLIFFFSGKTKTKTKSNRFLCKK
jgi:hypothetical protein